MNASRRARVLIALLASASALAVVRGAAQSEFTEFELTASPYLIVDVNRSIEERTARQLKLAGIAESAGDLTRAARHFAAACQGAMTLTGDRTLSAPACVRARALAEERNIVDVKVSLRVNEATIRGWTFDFQGAVNVLKQAIADGASLNPDAPEGAPLTFAHQMLGTIFSERGQFGEGERELTFASDHCRAQGNPGCVAYSNIYLCRLHVTLGDYGRARTACDTARAVAAIERDQLVMANLNWIQGTLEAAVGRHDAALESLQKAWVDAQMKGAEILLPILAQAITDSLLQLGRVDEAERWQEGLDKGLKDGTVPFFLAPQIAMRQAKIAVFRGKFDEAHTGFAAASKSILHEMSIRGYFGMALVSRLQGDLPAAQSALEEAIAKIETSRTNTAGAALRATYLTLHVGAYNELIGVRWDANGAAAASDALQIAEKGRARALLDALMSAQVEGAAAPTLDAKAVQATLTDDQVLIEYVSLDTRMFALTVTKDRIAFHKLPNAGTAAELNKRVDFFSTLAQESDEASLVPAAKRLYADLLAPALEGVPSTARTLIIAADGPLHRLPFDALGDSPRVIDRWDVVTMPSASALASRVRHAAPTEAALVVAAPGDAGLGMLAAAPAEAAAIRSRIGGRVSELTGAGATQQQLEASGLGKFAVLHFASHAIVDESKPLQSALILAPGADGTDRTWTAEEIYKTPLNADLVVLSACSTAAGADAPGEGVMSLARAFLYAGAGATVATLWDVPDAPGPVFADVLYRELSAGHTLGAATAEARRELRRRGAPPQAWAAYVLTGKPDAVVSVTPGTNPSIVRAGVAGGLAAALLVLALVLRSAAKALWRFRWPAPALASGVLVVFAAIQFLPSAPARLDSVSRVERGGTQAMLTATLVAGKLVWTPVTGADQHAIEVFDADGMPIGVPVNAASPFDLPASAAGGWIRVDARRDQTSIAQSALIRVPAR